MAYGQYGGYTPGYPMGGYGQPMPDQLAQWRAQPMQYPQMQSAPTPPSGAMIWVQGEAGAKSYLIAPGQRLLLMDSESEVFYIKETTPEGRPLPMRTFDYKERVPAQQSIPAPAMRTEQYVTRAEFEEAMRKIMNTTEAKREGNENAESVI